MALIIKNANIDQYITKKVSYSRTLDSESPSSEPLNEWLDDVDLHSANESEISDDSTYSVSNSLDSVNISNETLELKPIQDFEVVDEGLAINHLGIKYIHPDRIDEIIEKTLIVKKQELNCLVEEQKEIGYFEGYEEGSEKAKSEYLQKITTLNNLILSIETEFERKVQNTEKLLTDAIFAGVTRILGNANDNDRVSMIQNVVKDIGSTKPYILRLSVHDYDLFITSNNDIPHFNTQSIIADDRVELGGCIIETEKGIFDGRLEVQLARLKDVIDSKVD